MSAILSMLMALGALANDSMATVADAMQIFCCSQNEQACYEQAYYEQEFYEPAYYEEPSYGPTYDVPSDGLTPQSGVNYYDGRIEMYYSSNVLYHYNTSAWTVDEEGFYRTDEGYYVVAASDMPQGTTFECSKGTAQVLDSGCADGVTDFYVQW